MLHVLAERRGYDNFLNLRYLWRSAAAVLRSVFMHKTVKDHLELSCDPLMRQRQLFKEVALSRMSFANILILLIRGNLLLPLTCVSFWQGTIINKWSQPYLWKCYCRVSLLNLMPFSTLRHPWTSIITCCDRNESLSFQNLNPSQLSVSPSMPVLMRQYWQYTETQVVF